MPLGELVTQVPLTFASSFVTVWITKGPYTILNYVRFWCDADEIGDSALDCLLV